MSQKYVQWDRSLQPAAYWPPYKTSVARSPRFALISIEGTETDLTGPTFGHGDIDPCDADLLTNYAREPGMTAIGERIILHGRVLDENARPVPNALIEIWQANAGGRYRHVRDGYTAVLDPNFGGCGRTITDAEGRYAFRSIKPGAYPWPNRRNEWRPAHIHMSVFGRAFCQRLITQLYFEGDPLIPLCPIASSIPDPQALDSLVARMDLNATQPMDSIAWKFDVVLRGTRATYFENKPEGT